MDARSPAPERKPRDASPAPGDTIAAAALAPRPDAALLPDAPAPYRALLNALQDAILVCGPDGVVVEANRRAAELFGYGPEELRACPIARLLPGMTPGMLGRLQRHAAQGLRTALVGRCVARDGTAFDGEARVGPIDLTQEGQFLFAVRRALPPPLPAPAAPASPGALPAPALRAFLEALYDAVLLTDPAGRIVDANTRAEQFLGYDRDALTQLTVQQVVGGLDTAVLERILAHLEDGRFTLLDASCIRRDGTAFLAETAISRLRLGDDDRLAFLIRNVDRRRAAREQRRAEHTALRNLGAAVAIADLSGHVVYANPAFLRYWEYDREEDLHGRPIASFFHDAAAVGPMCERALAGATWTGELDAVARTGRMFPVSSTAAPSLDTEERQVGLALSFVDITELRRAQAAIRREAEAQLARARGEASFAGHLHVLSLPDVVQLVDATRKSGRLTVLDAAHHGTGEAFFDRGQVIRAACGDLRGEAAFRALVAQGGAEFVFESCAAAPPDPSIQRGTLALLLEAARDADEAAAAAGGAPRGDETGR